MSSIEQYAFPKGLRLLRRWQAGETEARDELRAFFDAAIAGDFDDNFKVQAPTDRVHSTASVHMLGLGLLHDLYGIETYITIMATPIAMPAPILRSVGFLASRNST